jgi:hypothetical protein
MLLLTAGYIAPGIETSSGQGALRQILVGGSQNYLGDLLEKSMNRIREMRK